MNNLFVYISYIRKEVNDKYVYFAKETGYNVLTREPQVKKDCDNLKIACIFLPTTRTKFINAINKIPINFIFLAGDFGDPHLSYIATNFKSGFIESLNFLTASSMRKLAENEKSGIWKKIHSAFNLTTELYGSKQLVRSEGFKNFITFLYHKFYWQLKMKYSIHGYYSDLIFLTRESQKKIWTDHFISSDKIFVTGSIEEDLLIKEIQKQKSTENSLRQPNDKSYDILFISQPLYMYPGGKNYLKELSAISVACRKKKLKMAIKLHPRDEISLIKKNVLCSSEIEFIEHTNNWSHQDSIKLIEQCKVAIGKGSNALIFPLLLNKPTIISELYDDSFNHFKRFMDYELTLRNIKNFKQIFDFSTNKANLDKIISMQHSLLRKVGKFDGKSCERIKLITEKFLMKKAHAAKL